MKINNEAQLKIITTHCGREFNSQMHLVRTRKSKIYVTLTKIINHKVYWRKNVVMGFLHSI